MIVIFVQKSWVDTIGDVADLLLIRGEQNGYVSVLAGKAVAGYPFVEAQLARKEVTESGKVFIPSSIPTNLVSGIFDVTEIETSKFGFHQPNKA